MSDHNASWRLDQEISRVASKLQESHRLVAEAETDGVPEWEMNLYVGDHAHAYRTLADLVTEAGCKPGGLHRTQTGLAVFLGPELDGVGNEVELEDRVHVISLDSQTGFGATPVAGAPTG